MSKKVDEVDMVGKEHSKKQRWFQRVNYIKKHFIINASENFESLENSENLLDDIVRRVEMNTMPLPIFDLNKENVLPNEPTIIKNGMMDLFPSGAKNVKKKNDIQTSFSIKNLLAKCSESYFRLDDNHTGRIRLKHFYQYMKNNQDNAPLYIFDSQFAQGADENRKSLSNDYIVPPLLSSDDLFSIVDKKRPPWQWLLIGSARSGTGIHQDPLGTSAWNAVVEGSKLWLFFSPHTPRDIIIKQSINSGINFFNYVYPQILNSKNKIESFYTIQKAGDIVFVPCDWYHVVVNLEDTVAITHNFAMKRHLHKIIPRVFNDEPKFGLKWLNALRINCKENIVCNSNVYINALHQVEKFIAENDIIYVDGSDNESEETSEDDDWSGSDESLIDDEI